LIIIDDLSCKANFSYKELRQTAIELNFDQVSNQRIF